MNALDYFFYLFAGLTLLCGLMVVANPFSRSPVNSAMFLVLMMVSLSGLYVTLHAFFLAAVQILVYAGAVMVLFLFVIMLLDLKDEEARRIKILALVMGALSVGSIAFIFVRFLGNVQAGSDAPTVEGSTVDLAFKLFKQYTLPFEIVSLLLLVAMIGAILLSKKEIK
jgi:NADH-quinone oxidoreductase subunit J